MDTTTPREPSTRDWYVRTLRDLLDREEALFRLARDVRFDVADELEAVADLRRMIDLPGNYAAVAACAAMTSAKIARGLEKLQPPAIQSRGGRARAAHAVVRNIELLQLAERECPRKSDRAAAKWLYEHRDRLPVDEKVRRLLDRGKEPVRRALGVARKLLGRPASRE